MVETGSLFSSVGSSFSGALGSIGSVVIGALALAIVGGLVYVFVVKRRMWNLIVNIKIPRSDGRIINAEIGKGSYDGKRGVVWIKRTGKSKVPMKPFDIKRYLQGSNILDVVQVGAEQYEPLLPESYYYAEDDKTGEQGVLMKIKMDTTESKSWRSSFEREAKQTYSIKSLLAEHGGVIAIGIVIFLWGIQFLAIYNKINP